jgi:glycolate oxidase iron-sulfur subunit
LNVQALGDVERFDAIVSDCASCSGHLKDYGALLAEDESLARKGRLVAERVRSFSEYLADQTVGGAATVPGRARGGDVGAAAESSPRDEPVSVTFHEPCHLGARYQGVVTQPRHVLRSLPGVEFRELPDADACCGAAGSYVLVEPEISAAILGRKMERVAATGADVLVTECPSCLLQLALGARRADLGVRVMGLSEFLLERAVPAPS